MKDFNKKNVFTQDYTPKEKIAGVVVQPMPHMVDDGGFFLELGRWQDHVMQTFPEFDLKQLNYSEVDPGVIKAWHLHYHQEDIWFVPPSHKLLVLLRDCREDSKTNGVMMRLTLGAGKGYLVHIPRGVAHGAANLWDKPAAIIYFVNNQFTPDPTSTDEHRLDWDYFGSDIWSLTKG